MRKFGVDLSKWNGKVDFKKLKEVGVEFVILRCGYASTGNRNKYARDPKFEEYYAAAKSVGLDYNYDTVPYTNTFDAHRIAKYAETKGKGLEMSEKLFHAYFTENKEMSDHKVLTDIAVELGLDKLEVEDVLKNNKFSEDVRNDEYEANRLRIHAVPFFLINGKYSLSGAQPPEAFENIFEKILQEEKIQAYNLEGISCNSDGCSIALDKK